MFIWNTSQEIKVRRADLCYGPIDPLGRPTFNPLPTSSFRRVRLGFPDFVLPLSLEFMGLTLFLTFRGFIERWRWWSVDQESKGRSWATVWEVGGRWKWDEVGD